MVSPINWNAIEDQKDYDIWKAANSQLWVAEEHPLSRDLSGWESLSPAKKVATQKVFAGLTTLDTLQGSVGMVSMLADVRTPHEAWNLMQFGYMECIHAQCYSFAGMTLTNSADVDRYFAWAEQNRHVQYKANRINEIYQTGTPLEKKIASVFLESFLFYSGFYLPLYLAAHGELTNTAAMIRDIIGDEAIHGYYIGYKFQLGFKEQSPEEQARLIKWADELLEDLYANEMEYIEHVYDEVGWTKAVKDFTTYNANKALGLLGFEAKYPRTLPDASVMQGLSLEGGNGDFFSNKEQYARAEVEAVSDDDFNF